MSADLISRLAAALDERGIPYMVIGGQAVLLYGEPRLTRDIDITLGITPDDLAHILDLVADLSLRVLVREVQTFVKKTWVLPVYHEESGMRVDFIFSWSPYEREAIQRANVQEVRGYPVRFARPEDVIIHKVLAGRPRDLEDIRSILRKQQVDHAYIRAWLKQFGEATASDFLSAYEKILAEEGDDTTDT